MRFKLKDVREFVGKEKLEKEDFSAYEDYVYSVAEEIEKGNLPYSQKVSLINKIFLQAKRSVISAGKANYKPKKGEMKAILKEYSHFVPNLNLSPPFIRYVNTSILHPELNLEVCLADHSNSTIEIRPPYFLASLEEQKLTVYEELAHHALSTSVFSTLSDIEWSLNNIPFIYKMRREQHSL